MPVAPSSRTISEPRAKRRAWPAGSESCAGAAGPQRLAPIPASVELGASARKVWQDARAALRATAAACLAAISRALVAARRGADRALWRLGYAQIEIVDDRRQLAPRRSPATTGWEPARDYGDGPHERATVVYPTVRDGQDRAFTDDAVTHVDRADVIARRHDAKPGGPRGDLAAWRSYTSSRRAR